MRLGRAPNGVPEHSARRAARTIPDRRTEDTTSEAHLFLHGISGHAPVGCAVARDAKRRLPLARRRRPPGRYRSPAAIPTGPHHGHVASVPGPPPRLPTPLFWDATGHSRDGRGGRRPQPLQHLPAARCSPLAEASRRQRAPPPRHSKVRPRRAHRRSALPGGFQRGPGTALARLLSGNGRRLRQLPRVVPQGADRLRIGRSCSR